MIETIGMYIVDKEDRVEILDFVRKHYCGILEVASKDILPEELESYLDGCQERKLIPWAHCRGEGVDK